LTRRAANSILFASAFTREARLVEATARRHQCIIHQ
jgi:hypothetical protein